MIQCIKSVSPLADYAMVCQDIQSLLRQVNCDMCQPTTLASFALRYPSVMYWVDIGPCFMSIDILNDLVE